MQNSLLLTLVIFSLGLSGCASMHRHQKVKASDNIILNGEPNPYLTDDPAHAGEVIRNAPR